MSDESRTDLQALQDYLDGRLSSARRAEFESLLERDAGLRAELESAFELRAALEHETAELSPGFYTRTRARFEEVAREPMGWSLRLLSWETAGVAAAAALATALFVPWLTQQGVPTDLGAAANETRQAVVHDELKDRDSSFAPTAPQKEAQAEPESAEAKPAREKNRAAQPAPPEAKREEGRREVRDDPKPAAQAPVGFADARSDRLEGPAAAGEKALAPAPRITAAESAGVESGRARMEQDDAAFRSSAPTEAGKAAASGVDPEDLAAPLDEVEKKRGSGKRAAPAKANVASAVVELPAGLVERGRLRIVERVEEWSALLGSPQGQALRMLGSPAGDRRLILIGGRLGLSCDFMNVIDDGDAYRIEAMGGPTAREALDGCALLLPHDGRAVSIADPR